MSVYEAGAFASDMSRNSDSGAAYRFTRLGGEFEDYDRSDAIAQLKRLGHEIIGSFLEPKVVDVDTSQVAYTGVIKVLPELSRAESDQLAADLSNTRGAVEIRLAQPAYSEAA